MDSKKVSDLMTTDFVKFSPDMLVVEAVKELVKHEVLGGPVVADDGAVIGWLSEQDCLHASIQVLYFNQRVAKVEDVMHSEVFAINQDQDFLGLAEQMLGAAPKVYPVIDDHKKLVGVISRRLILRAMDKMLKEMSVELHKH